MATRQVYDRDTGVNHIGTLGEGIRKDRGQRVHARDVFVEKRCEGCRALNDITSQRCTRCDRSFLHPATQVVEPVTPRPVHVIEGQRPITWRRWLWTRFAWVCVAHLVVQIIALNAADKPNWDRVEGCFWVMVFVGMVLLAVTAVGPLWNFSLDRVADVSDAVRGKRKT